MRPSLEQLQKQAKDLLREYRAADPAAIERFRTAGAPEREGILADAQFVIARENGFASWAKLKHQIEAAQPSAIEAFEKLAAELAEAHMSGNAMAIREINWRYGTSFVCDYHDPLRAQEQLTTWFASPARDPELAIADARQMVAHAYGCEHWADFDERLGRHRQLYKLDRAESRVRVGGPLFRKDWDIVAALLKEHKATALNAGGITDDGLERISRLDHVTRLDFDGGLRLTDEGLLHLARMPQLEELNLSGWKGRITDRGLQVLRQLPALRKFAMCWQQNVSDAGAQNLALCDRLESVDLMGTPCGDGAIQALAGKAKLRHFKTGRGVTDEGLKLLRGLPVFAAWQGGEVRYGLMTFGDAEPNHLLVDGPFTNQGIGALAALEGIFGLNFFWHCPAMTGAGLEPLRDLPNLGVLGIDGKLCDDEAMRHIATIPRLRMLMAQGTVAGDVGFAALSRSRSLEHLWGRECPNLSGRGFRAMSAMPSLRGLAVSCKNVDDASLAALPDVPELRGLMPMDVPDEGFRHVGRCARLEKLWCMYCRDTGDAATEHLPGLSRLAYYYAGQTRITDASLEILARMESLEHIELWACAGISDAGVARLTGLPRLREISIEGSPRVTEQGMELFPESVRIKYDG